MSNDTTQQQQLMTPFDGYGNDLTVVAGDRGAGMLAGMNVPGANGNGAAGMNGAARETMLKRAHHYLRGRYWIAVPLGLMLGMVGGYLGYTLLHPIYRGEGMIQISALNTKDPTNQTTVMQNFEEYVQSQAMLMGSRTVIDKAMRGSDWVRTRMGADGETMVKVSENLLVEHPPHTEMIRIYYTDPDPDVAKFTVQAIVAAYVKFAMDRSQVEDQKHLKIYEMRRGALLDSARNVKDKLDAAVNESGIPDLAPLLEAKVAEETRVERQLQTAQLALDASRAKKNARQAVYDLTENQVSMLDPAMRGLVLRRDEIKVEVAKLQAAGVMDESARMKLMKAQLDDAQRRVDQYLVDWRDLQTKFSNDETLGSGSIPRMLQMSEKWLASEVERLQQSFAKIQEDRKKMGSQVLQIQDLRRQQLEIEKDKGDTQRMIDTLSMASFMSSRLTVQNLGDVPAKPYKDRRLAVAAMGAAGGMGFPMLFFLTLGVMDRRYRYSDEAGEGREHLPLLGILPRLPDQLSDPEQAAIAAHCIHQIRIMLQVGPSKDRRRVFMVTSASTGDGKTSLTMALGLSFAASGSKTLVIDCDMVGQGLTHRLKASNVPGLLETLNTGTLRGHVRRTGTKGMYVLPIGNAAADDAGSLSPAGIKQLLAACCEHFDIVVIDTGPILGSLEASIIATEADGVIMAVARGQHQPIVEKSIKHLRAIGAKIFGIVFNRAEARDFHRSVASTSMRSISSSSSSSSTRPVKRALLPSTDESSRFGPLAYSVASCRPGGHGGANGNGNGNGNGHANGNGNGNGSARAEDAAA